MDTAYPTMYKILRLKYLYLGKYPTSMVHRSRLDLACEFLGANA